MVEEMRESGAGVTIVVVAGGSGRRMGYTTPKQYLKLEGKPILIHTIERLHRALPQAELILVVPGTDREYVRGLLTTYHQLHHPKSSMRVVAGGASRAESVMQGLSEVRTPWVMVHDGVRPFVSEEVLRQLLLHLKEHRAVLPALTPTDSIRMLDERGIPRAVPREQIYTIQTPQAFDTALLQSAYARYQREPDKALTDDASIVEQYQGIVPYIIKGNRENIKITLPLDLELARLILQEEKGESSSREE